MEHAWLELRHDQKWCRASTTKVPTKRRKLDDSTGASSEHADEAMARPEGIKAAKAKAKGKKGVAKPSTMEADEREFENMWDIRKRDFDQKQTLNNQKQKLNNQKLLDSLITKTEPLTELEMALKDKLLTEFLGI